MIQEKPILIQEHYWKPDLRKFIFTKPINLRDLQFKKCTRMIVVLMRSQKLTITMWFLFPKDTILSLQDMGTTCITLIFLPEVTRAWLVQMILTTNGYMEPGKGWTPEFQL